MFGISQAIKEFFAAMGLLFGWQAERVEHRAESVVIEDKEDGERAMRHAERAINTAFRYKDSFRILDRKSFERNVRQFRNLK